MSDWRKVSEPDYFDALEAVQPALYMPFGFLHGEPHDYRICIVSGTHCAEYAAYARVGDIYYGGRFMTVNELRRFDPRTLRAR